MNMSLSAAAASMDGTLKGVDRNFVGVSTDTRALAQDELFFALSGPNFDGSDFVPQARARGAAGAVVAALLDQDIAQIEVDDPRLALGRLGRAWRERHDATVVGITGSTGKTTVMRAMDEQYDRIDNMMFVGTVYEQEDGELAVEEDGCD